jgi:hypothetical protein
MTEAQLDRLEWFDLLPSDADEVGGAIDCADIRIFEDGSWQFLRTGGKGGYGASVFFTGYHQ